MKEEGSKVCPKCKQTNEFGVDPSKKDGLSYMCKPCKSNYCKSWQKSFKGSESYKKHVVYLKDRRNNVKQQALEYKGGKCVACDYNKCKEALAFHHLDPAKKDFRISNGRSYSWKKIKAELDKCVLVCHNCHIEIHNGVSQWTPKNV